MHPRTLCTLRTLRAVIITVFMGDAGEGLIDAEARLQERMDELEESRKVAKDRGPRVDPEHVRAVESLRLARTELQRQLETTTHAARKDQIGQAIAEIERRLSDMNKKK
jgi:hypothetical protein